jgi:hypothetical protein
MSSLNSVFVMTINGLVFVQPAIIIKVGQEIRTGLHETLVNGQLA